MGKIKGASSIFHQYINYTGEPGNMYAVHTEGETLTKRRIMLDHADCGISTPTGKKTKGQK